MILSRYQSDGFLFSPREAERQRREALTLSRKTPPGQGNEVGSNRKRRPAKAPGERYQVSSYSKAVGRACEKVGVPHWHPHRIRHNSATRLVAEFGWSIAQTILGHRTLDASRIYGEDNLRAAIDAMAKIG